MTYGLKAKKTLSAKGVISKLIKISSNSKDSGCTYGLELDYKNLFIAKKILKDAEIPFSANLESYE
jgi:hypothetical protein